MINDMATVLEKKRCDYYTYHCTGKKAYERVLGDRLEYLLTGTEVLLEE